MAKVYVGIQTIVYDNHIHTHIVARLYLPTHAATRSEIGKHHVDERTKLLVTISG
jgi:hypothetical protein